MRGLRIVLATALAAAAVAVPAWAITHGSSDNGAHPYVGALGFTDADGDFLICSGTLVDADTFVTAAHCIDFLESLEIPVSDVWVTFDDVVDDTLSTVAATAIHTASAGNGFAHDIDLAVVELDGSTPTTPVEIVSPGALDEMKASRALADQEFTNVGYGSTQRIKQGPGSPAFTDPARRMVSVSSYSALGKNWLHLSQNAATGDAGTCYGDSGGPQFIGARPTLVSITVTGDDKCVSRNIALRLDTPQAQDFLGDFVDLP